MEFKTMSLINLSMTFVMFSLVLGIARSTVNDAPAPSPDSQLIHVREECAHKLSSSCGDSIFHYVFGAAVGEVVTNECCEQLLRMGRHCHTILTSATIDMLHESGKRKEQIISRNNEIWKLCLTRNQIH